MSNDYYRLQFKKISSEALELLSDFCFSHGALGMDESLDFKQPDLVYEATVVEKKSHDVNFYFDTKPSEDFFLQIQSRFSADYEVFNELNKDWLAEWKKSFKSFHLVGPFWVVPSWLEVPKEAKTPLKIDPGMAFGTGTHATTQLAAKLVTDVCKKDFSVIDVGTGTAILAMLAYHLGATHIVGNDNDPEARRVARENIQLNHATVDITDLQIDQIKESFDLVIANIIDGVLLKLKPDLLRIRKPQGKMILSGVLLEREAQFIEPFLKNSRLKIEKRLEQDEWLAYLLSEG